MRPSVTSKILRVAAHDDKWTVYAYWLSASMLAAGFLCALTAIVIRADAGWPEAVLLLLAAVGTVIALTRQLPLQNVLLTALLIAVIGGVAHTVSVKSGLPFGLFFFGAGAGWKIFDTLPWAVPLLWVVMILNSRGVARLILRPWRKMRTYGLWLMGMTALLTLLFDCALEPFASLKHYWLWRAGGFSLTPQGAPLTNAIGWFFVTLLILAFTTPLLINKQLSKRSAPDFHPLAVWLGGILLFGVAAGLGGFWAVVTVDGIIGGSVAAFAVRGARW